MVQAGEAFTISPRWSAGLTDWARALSSIGERPRRRRSGSASS